MNNKNKITDNIAFFKEKGFVILEDVFSREECDLVIETAHDILGENNKDLTPLMNIHKSSNNIQKFMSKPILINFIEQFFQGTALGLQTEFFFMPPKTVGFNPHQDNSYVNAAANSFVSAWVALTDIDKSNGGLIIWPETHVENRLDTIKTGLSKSKNQDPNAVLKETVIPEKYDSKDVVIKKGSVLMIHSWLVHASNTNNSSKNRYVLLCTYLKQNSNFREGIYAKREPFHLTS
tara:strand:- start:5841 stop:6545 length:705 start_codon:yes stop_codon:yes gene_type:complete